MIKSVNVSNYKLIKDPVYLSFDTNYPYSAIFGRNNSGKTTLFESIYNFKEVFIFGMRSVNRLDGITNAKYTFEFTINGKDYIYETHVNYEKLEVNYEALKLKTRTTQHIYFIRDQYDISLGEKLEKLFTSFDFDRFKIYLYDLRYDRREFILSHLRIKDFSESSNALILNQLVLDISQMHIINQNLDIKFYPDIDDTHYVRVINFIQSIYPDIQSLQYRTISLDTLRFNLNRHRYDHLLDEFRNHVIKFNSERLFVEVYNQFYKLKGKTLDELVIQSVDVHFNNGFIKPFSEVSSGLRKLLVLSMILLKHQERDLLLIDDLTHNLDHETTIKLIKYLRPLLIKHQRHLVFSSKDMLLLDNEIFDQKELIYTVYNHSTKLFYLSNLRIRKDKKLLNLYLGGFFNDL